MSLRGTKYIHRRGNTFQLRLPIPLDIQAKLNRKELRWSLGTGDASIAKRKAFRATLLFMELCDSVRSMQEISDAKAHEIISAFYRLLVQSYTPPAIWKPKSADLQAHEHLDAADNFAVDFQEQLNEGSLTEAQLAPVREITKGQGVSLEKLSPERQLMILSGIAKAYFENVRFLEHVSGSSPQPYAAKDELFKYIDHLQLIAGVTPKSSKLPQDFPQNSNSHATEEIATKYQTKGAQSGVSGKGPWGTTSIAVNSKILKWFIEHVGIAKPLELVTVDHCREFRDGLLLLRSGASEKHSFTEAQTTDKHKRISSTTAKNQFGYLKSFLAWCASEGYLSKSPAADLKIIASQTPPHEKRRPFKPEELNTLFSSPMYAGYASAVSRHGL